MGTYTLNRGNQQVTIYPYQDLTSYYGNQILYGLIPQGVFTGEASVIDGGSLGNPYTSHQAVFRVSPGSVFVFIRNYTTKDGLKKFVGKIVLEDEALIDITKTILWKTPSYTTGVTSLLLTADWTYNLENPAERFIDFEILTDLQRASALAAGKIIVAEFLNHQYFVQNAGSDSPYPEVSLTDYQVQYPFVEGQPRHLFTRLEKMSKQMPVVFAANGNTITVGPGVVWNADTLLSIPATTSPPIPLRASIPSGHTANEYYQIDVLRLTHLEETQEIILKWDSFLKEKPTPEWNFSNIPAIPQSTITSYLSGFEFALEDPGMIILFGVRNCASIPTSNPTSTKLWPGQCFILDYFIPQLGAPEYYTRWKLPVHDV